MAKLFPILAGLMLASCSDHRPEVRSPLPIEKLQDVYVALLLQGEKARSSPAAQEAVAADSILASFGTTQKEFREAIAACSVDVGKWQEFYAGVIARLEAKKRSQPGASPPQR